MLDITLPQLPANGCSLAPHPLYLALEPPPSLPRPFPPSIRKGIEAGPIADGGKEGLARIRKGEKAGGTRPCLYGN